MAAMVCLRFFAGFFGSSGPALGVATVSDVFNPRERGTPISIYAIGPMVLLALCLDTTWNLCLIRPFLFSRQARFWALSLEDGCHLFTGGALPVLITSPCVTLV